jgi:hypothetical protein
MALTPEDKIRIAAELRALEEIAPRPKSRKSSRQRLGELEKVMNSVIQRLSDLERANIEIENPELRKRRLDFEAREAEKYLPKKFQTV